MSLLRVQDLWVRYRTRRGVVEALSGVSLSVEEGEVLGVVGESGSGKSTLGLAVIRLLPRSAEVRGSVLLNGKDLTSLPEEELRRIRGREVSMVFQDPYSSLNPVMRIGDHFVELMMEHGAAATREEALEAAGELLERLGVPRERLNDYPHQLSGGQRQRVAIARAIVLRPKLLIADEPISNIDVSARAQILELLRSLRERMGLSMLYITHDLSSAWAIADSVAVMYLGKLVEHGPLEEVFSDPRHPYTKALLQAVPSLDERKAGGEVVRLKGEIPDPLNMPSGCRLHPRCPFATERCRREEPPAVKVGENHWVYCHLFA